VENKPEYLITYQCQSCGERSAFADEMAPNCRHCDEETHLHEVQRQKITPELMEKQLRESAQRMMNSLQSAFESMTEEDKAAFGDVDAEKEMLLIMARAQKLKEEIEKLKLKKPE
jgi:predicted ATP-dependent serine protease